MQQNKPFSLHRIALYFGIIFFIGYFFTKNTIDFSQLVRLQWTDTMIKGVLLAAAMLVLRDLGYVIRLRLLTDKAISLRECIRIVLLWEFGSAITPGMIGGKAVAIYMLVKNKIHAAKASSIVLMAILLDEIIFIVLFPIFYFLFREEMFRFGLDCPDWLALKSKMPWIDNIQYLEYTVFVMLALLFGFVAIVFMGIFIYPSWIRQFIKTIGRFPLWSKWRSSIHDFADEVHQTSLHIRKKRLRFWLELTFSTFISWCGRYLVGVAIVYGFSTGHIDWMYVYVKQYALWLMFYLPSTPGSSGIAEALYMAFYCDSILPGLSGTAAFVWRFMSYYIYLFIGLVILLLGKSHRVVARK